MDGTDGGFAKKNRIMKKAVYNKYGTRQIIDSGWKEFDRQTNCISTGNVYANTQISSFIRPWSQTECNNHTFPEGQLMNYDLQQFDRFNIPTNLLDVIKDKNRKDSVILYMFFTVRQGHVVPFGWVLSERDYSTIGWGVVRHYGESYIKRWKALNEAIQYIQKDV